MNNTDYLSRKAIVKNLTDGLKHYEGRVEILTYRIIERFMEYIKEFPAADVQTVDRWISVKERLPEDNSLVLIIGGGHRCIAVYNESKQRFYLDDDYYEVSQVTHWLPVPEIPQEE